MEKPQATIDNLKHTHGQEAGRWILVIHPSPEVWGLVLLIWGDCQEPPTYTELIEGLSSKCKDHSRFSDLINIK